MQIIAISGLDGSGKTTQLDLLEKELVRRKKSVYMLHIIKFSLVNKTLDFFKRSKKRHSAHQNPSKAITKASSTTIFLRKIALLLDATRFHLFIFSLKLNKAYDYLLVDRYFYDQIVNIHYLERNLAPTKDSWWQRLAEQIIFSPDHAIFIKVSPEKAIAREREIEQGKQFLEDKQLIFNSFLDSWKINLVNGNNSAEEVHEQITKIINTNNT